MIKASKQAVRRPRNAAVTREAILAAARMAFARESYEQVGVREIAAVAGVNGALVIRYFGSKDQLFIEAVTQKFSLGDLLSGERSQAGERLARYVLQKDASGDSLDPIITLLRSATHPQASVLLQQGLEDGFIRPLAQWLGGEQAVLRAGLIAAYLTGLTVSRFVIRIKSLSESEPEPLVALAAPVLQMYIDGAPSTR